MTAPRYVQHTSGQGETYLVGGETSVSWRIRVTEPDADLLLYDLPKSQYHLVPVPERWVDVTAECEIPPFTRAYCEVWHGGNRLCVVLDGYRLSKIQHDVLNIDGTGNHTSYEQCWAFLVEKRAP